MGHLRASQILLILTELMGILFVLSCRTPEKGSPASMNPKNTSSLGAKSDGPLTMLQCEWKPGPGPHKTRKIIHIRPRGFLEQEVNTFVGYTITKSKISLNEWHSPDQDPLPRLVSAPDAASCVGLRAFASPTTLAKEQRLLLPVGILRPTNEEEIGALPTGSYVPFRIFEVTTKKLKPLEAIAVFCGGKSAQIKARQEQDVTTIQGVFEDLPFLMRDSLKTIDVSDETLRKLVEFNPAYIQEMNPSDILGPTPQTFVGWPLDWQPTKMRFQDHRKRLRTIYEFTLLNHPFPASCNSSEENLETF